MNSLFVYNNGIILPADSPTVHAGNRGFNYGDGVFESIRLINGLPINMEAHVNRLRSGVKGLKMIWNPDWDIAFFETKIIELAVKSGITLGGRAKIHIDRQEGGYYIPASNEGTVFMDVYPIESNQFELNTKGWEIDQYQDLKKQINQLANLKTKNGLIYIMAGIASREKNFDDLLIGNDRNGIIESSSSNLFVVSNGVLYTPGLDEGCLAGTMRMQIINFAIANKIKVYECNILPQNLLSADEIFLTNAIRGVTWVGGYRTKRYFNNTARKFVAFLNDKWIVD